MMSDAALPDARIGPNAVIQTLRAIAEIEGPEAYDAIARHADLPALDSNGMIPEAWFLRLVQALREFLPWSRSEAVLRRAGDYTADYVRTHRIPRAARWLLHVLPGRVALPLLLTAFARNAWTFAGSGRYRVEGGFPGEIVLEGCPTCRTAAREHAAGAYYAAAFEGLLRLACPAARVAETACQSRGAAACRFSIALGEARYPGEKTCASS